MILCKIPIVYLMIKPKYIIILLRIGFVATKVGQDMKHKFAVRKNNSAFCRS